MIDISEMMIWITNKEHIISFNTCCRGPKGNIINPRMIALLRAAGVRVEIESIDDN